jgi:protein-tyrosine phosphatase
MLNLRQINRKFFLSGGWVNVGDDAKLLTQLNVACVLDLQYTPDEPDFNKSAEFTIRQVLEHNNIQYWVIPMFDGPNKNLDELFEEGYNAISAWLAEIKHKKILIKCSVGVSRSAAMLIYFLCRSQGTDYQTAYNLLVSSGSLYMESAFKDRLKELFPSNAPVSKFKTKYGI